MAFLGNLIWFIFGGWLLGTLYLIAAIVLFPLLPFLMKEYAAGGSNNMERFYGLKLCSARNVIENLFGRLKGRFGCLKRCLTSKIYHI